MPPSAPSETRPTSEPWQATSRTSPRAKGIDFLASRGHDLANAHVVKAAREAGARMVLDSDAHAPSDLLTREFAMKVALGAGLSGEDAQALLETGPRDMLAEIGLEQNGQHGRPRHS